MVDNFLSWDDGSLYGSYAEFIQHYEFAAQFCAGMRVIEAACGTGYGTRELVRHAASIIAFDADPEAIWQARRDYARFGIDFRVLDAAEIETCGPADVVVCIGALPNFEDRPGFVRVANRMAPLTIVTVPNGKQGYDRHLEHYSEATFRALMTAAFPRVEFHGQWVTAQGELRKRRDRERFDYLCELSGKRRYMPIRGLKRLLGWRVLPQPMPDHSAADSHGGDHIIAPLDDPPFPWPPVAFVAVAHSG